MSFFYILAFPSECFLRLFSSFILLIPTFLPLFSLLFLSFFVYLALSCSLTASFVSRLPSFLCLLSFRPLLPLSSFVVMLSKLLLIEERWELSKKTVWKNIISWKANNLKQRQNNTGGEITQPRVCKNGGAIETETRWIVHYSRLIAQVCRAVSLHLIFLNTCYFLFT